MQPRKVKIRLASACLAFSALSAGTAFAGDDLIETVKSIEARLGGDARVGFALTGGASGQIWSHRGDERFPMSSTFKVFLCAALLEKVDRGEDSLSRVVRYGEDQLVPYSPVTSKHTPYGMTLGALCRATTTISDNTAGNLVLEAIGGPEGFTRFMRSIGDDVTRLDRWEVALNESAPGDEHDTTTPLQIIDSLGTVVFGDTLSEAGRAQLHDWLVGQEVADALFRAHLPEGWEIGDKSGAGGFGSRSIIAVVWPPDGAPALTSLYITQTDADFPARNAAVAEVGATMFEALK